MSEKYIKFNHYFPLHLWNLKEPRKDKVIEIPFTKSKENGTVIFGKTRER